jgi:hypothetical protein
VVSAQGAGGNAVQVGEGSEGRARTAEEVLISAALMLVAEPRPAGSRLPTVRSGARQHRWRERRAARLGVIDE